MKGYDAQPLPEEDVDMQVALIVVGAWATLGLAVVGAATLARHIWQAVFS